MNEAHIPFSTAGYVSLGITRILLGWTFLWAFVDKLFGLGFATTAEKAWIHGGSPTMGFLKFGTKGPFAGVFQAMAGSAFVDWLFMIGLLCIGLSLLLGIGLNIAAASGSVMMILMWLSLLFPENNPIVDEHLIYMAILITLASFHAGDYLGLGKKWANTKIVEHYPFLR